MLALIPGVLVLLMVYASEYLFPKGLPSVLLYHGRRSERSPETRIAARAMAGEYLVYLAWMTLNTGITCWVLDLAPLTGLIITLGAMVLMAVVLVVLVEYRLERNFDEAGFPRRTAR